MTMMRWDPFREMMSLRQAMDRLFEDSFVRRPYWWPALAEGALPLSLEMYQTANDVVVKAAVPGAKPEEVDISITGDTLTIKGERKEEAAFENGILTLTLPKKEEAKPKQVKIKPKATIEGAKGAKKTKSWTLGTLPPASSIEDDDRSVKGARDRRVIRALCGHSYSTGAESLRSGL